MEIKWLNPDAKFDRLAVPAESVNLLLEGLYVTTAWHSADTEESLSSLMSASAPLALWVATSV